MLEPERSDGANLCELKTTDSGTPAVADQENRASRPREEASGDTFLEPDHKRAKLILPRTVEENCEITMVDNYEAEGETQSVGNKKRELKEPSDGKKECASHEKNAEKTMHDAYKENGKCEENASADEDATNNENMVTMEGVENGKCCENDGDNTGGEPMDCEDNATGVPDDEQEGPAPQSSWSGICVSSQDGALTPHRAAAVPVTREVRAEYEEAELYNFPLPLYTHAIDTRLCRVVLARKLTSFEKQFVQLYTILPLDLKEEIIVPLYSYLGNPRRVGKRKSYFKSTSGIVLPPPTGKYSNGIINKLSALTDNFHNMLIKGHKSEEPVGILNFEEMGLKSELNKECDSEVTKNLELCNVGDTRRSEESSASSGESQQALPIDDCAAEVVAENTVNGIEEDSLKSTRNTEIGLGSKMHSDPKFSQSERNEDQSLEMKRKEFDPLTENQQKLKMTELFIESNFAEKMNEKRESEDPFLKKSVIPLLCREVLEPDEASVGGKTSHLSQVPVTNIDEGRTSADVPPAYGGGLNILRAQTDLKSQIHKSTQTSSLETLLDQFQIVKNITSSSMKNIPPIEIFKNCAVINTLVYIQDLKEHCADADFIKSTVSNMLNISVEEILTNLFSFSSEQEQKLTEAFDILYKKWGQCVHPKTALSEKCNRQNDFFKDKGETEINNGALTMHIIEKISSKHRTVRSEKYSARGELKCATLDNRRHKYLPSIGIIIDKKKDSDIVEYFKRTPFGFGLPLSIFYKWPSNSFNKYKTKLHNRVLMTPPVVFKFMSTKLEPGNTIHVGYSTSQKNSHLFTAYAKKEFPYTFKVNITLETHERPIESSEQMQKWGESKSFATGSWQDNPSKSISRNEEKFGSLEYQSACRSASAPLSLHSTSPKIGRESWGNECAGRSTTSLLQIRLPSLKETLAEMNVKLICEKPKTFEELLDECRTDIFPQKVDAAIAGPSRQSDARTTSRDTRPTQRTSCSVRFESILAYLHCIVSRVTGTESHFEGDESGIYGEHRSVYKRPGYGAPRCYVSKGQRRVDLRTVDQKFSLYNAMANGLLLNPGKTDIQNYGRLVYSQLMFLSGTTAVESTQIQTQISILTVSNLENYTEKIYSMDIISTDVGNSSRKTAQLQTCSSPEKKQKTSVCRPPSLDAVSPFLNLIEDKMPTPAGGSRHAIAEPVQKSETNETVSKFENPDRIEQSGTSDTVSGTRAYEKASENGLQHVEQDTFSETAKRISLPSSSTSPSESNLSISSQQTTVSEIPLSQATFSGSFLTTALTSASVIACATTSAANSTASSRTSSTASTDEPKMSPLLCPNERTSAHSSGVTRIYHFTVCVGAHDLSGDDDDDPPKPVIHSGMLDEDLLGYEVFVLQQPLALAAVLCSELTDVIQRITPCVVATARNEDGRSTVIYEKIPERTLVSRDSLQPLVPRHAMLLSEYLGYYHGVMTLRQMENGFPSGEFPAEVEDHNYTIQSLVRFSEISVAGVEHYLLAEGEEYAQARKYVHERYYLQSSERYQELIRGFPSHCRDFVSLVNGCVALDNISVFATKEQITHIQLNRWCFSHENYCVYDLLCLIVLCTDACSNQPYISALVLTYIRAFENIHESAKTGIKLSGPSFKLMMEYSCRRLVVQMLAQPSMFFDRPDWLSPLLAAVEKTMHILGDYLLPSQSRPNARVSLGED